MPEVNTSFSDSGVGEDPMPPSSDCEGIFGNDIFVCHACEKIMIDEALHESISTFLLPECPCYDCGIIISNDFSP